MGSRMADVGRKAVTDRRAVAVGALRMGRRAFNFVRAGKLPKGDPFGPAQAAGLLAAKRTAELLPLCHPLPLDLVEVDFVLDESLPGVRARCLAATAAKTGVEMEALSGVSGALLCVYDLVKPVDPALTIEDIRLVFKEGGKRGHWVHPAEKDVQPVKAVRPPRLGKAVAITVSDRVSAGKAEDRSGPLLAAGLREMGFSVSRPVVVPDDPARIRSALLRASKSAAAVVLTGGTGLSPRDVTPEAVLSVSDRVIPGVGELLRASGGPATAPLSRSLAAQKGACVIVALPGSPGGVRDGLAVLRGLLPHAVHIAQGGGH
ncbi:MAG: bifunctional molybdenum cofactor biosynthesis protein MoaC/MoaB [Elusimicrobia bacterium]|nr:bifunctional molybdenum cofactor biosynthesis protein MoaC/MoaB [Elusimicrobiota bacterium]